MARRLAVNIETCMGCHSCELACAVAHSDSKDLESVLRAEERPGYRINVEIYSSRAVPVNCSHCEEAACILACPTGAVHRKEEKGPVLVDDERCIGCKMCVQACPFGMMTVRFDGKGVLKCDLCLERLADGKEPACVEACPTKTIIFAEEEDANRVKRRKVAGQLVAALEQSGPEDARGGHEDAGEPGDA